MSLKTPNYTQIPNDLLGNILTGNLFEAGLMAELNGAELKLYLAICRITFGYHQSERRASINDIMTLTGLSRQSVYNAAERLEGKNLIARLKDGGVTLWQVVVYNLDTQEEIRTDEHVKKLDTSTGESVQKLDTHVKKLDTHLRKKPKKKPTTKKETTIGETSPLLPDSKESELLFKMLGDEFAAKGRRKPKKFPSMACKRKFDARAEYLNGNTEAAITRALEKGILSVSGVVDFIAKWNPGKANDNGTHIRNDQPIKKSGRALDDKPTFDPYTGRIVPANS